MVAVMCKYDPLEIRIYGKVALTVLKVPIWKVLRLITSGHKDNELA